MNSIQIPFALDEPVWWVGRGYREEWVRCPECAGTKTITMILGNGEQVSLACELCSVGFNNPQGVIKKITYEHAPKLFTPHRVRVDGSEIVYSREGPDAHVYGMVYAENMFHDKAACQARCEQLNRERTQQEEKQQYHILKSTRTKLAWSVHYWRSKIADLEKDLDRARGYLEAARAKESKKKGESCSQTSSQK